MKYKSRRKIQKILINEINQIVEKENEKRKKYVKFCNFILKENYPLLENRKYLTRQELNEGMFDTIMDYGKKYLGNLFPGFIGDIKQKIATGLLKNIGLNPRSAFGRIIINTFEEIKYTELMDYFSDWKTGCPKFIDTFLRALSDSLVEWMSVRFLGAKNPEQVSGIVGTAREAFTTSINDELIPKISPLISKYICNLDLTGMISKIKDIATGKAKPEDLVKGLDASKIVGALKTSGQGEKSADVAKTAAEELAAHFGKS